MLKIRWQNSRCCNWNACVFGCWFEIKNRTTLIQWEWLTLVLFKDTVNRCVKCTDETLRLHLSLDTWVVGKVRFHRAFRPQSKRAEKWWFLSQVWEFLIIPDTVLLSLLFTSFTNYYERFIKQFKSLTDLLTRKWQEKCNPWRWRVTGGLCYNYISHPLKSLMCWPREHRKGFQFRSLCVSPQLCSHRIQWMI